MSWDSYQMCYICDGTTLRETSDKLLCKLTESSRVSFPSVISTLISDEFVLIVGNDDVICERCIGLVNKLDKLQLEIESVRQCLSEFLSKKYQISLTENCNKEIEESEELYKKSDCNDEALNRSNLNADCFLKELHMPPVNQYSCETRKVNKENSIYFSKQDQKCVSDTSIHSKKCEGSQAVITENLCDEKTHSAGRSVSISQESCELEGQTSSTSEVSLNGNVDNESAYFLCDLCNSLLKSEAEFKQHVCSQNSNKIDLACVLTENESSQVSEKVNNMIEITIVDKDSLKSGEKELTSNLKCYICNAVKKSRSNLALHILSHYPVKKNKGIVCPECDADFISLLEFMNHYDTHVSVDNVSISKCITTKRSTTKRKKDAIWKKVVRQNEICIDSSNDQNTPVSILCPFCKKAHNSHLDLNSHLKLQHNVNPCPYCKKGFPSDLKLKEHLVVHEAKIDRDQCEYCLVKFNTTSELESHVKKVHSQVDLTKTCPVCRKQCGSSVSVKRHVLKGHLIPVLQQEIRENYSHGSDLVDDLKNLGASEKFIQRISDINNANSVENNLKFFKMIVNVEASDVNFCLLCGFSSKSMTNLDKHREKHSSKKIPCPLSCDYLSCDADELVLHLSESHTLSISDSYCPHCLSEPAEDISLHMKALHSKFYTHLTCFVCKDMFYSKESLKYHFSVTHLICDQQFVDKNDDLEIDDNSIEADDPGENCVEISLEDKMMQKELDTAFETITQHSPKSLGPQLETDNSNPDSNNQQNETTSENIFNEITENICILCRKECISQEELVKHMTKHSSISEDIECPFCIEILHDHEHLRLHMVKEHPASAQNYCLTCNKSFPSKNSFVKHLSSKCPNRTCEVCSQKFPNISTFVQHVSYSHRKDFTCIYCKKLCKSLNHLKYHERIHIKYKGKIFKCDECGKTFQTPTSLKSHSISHTGNYPFVCEFCGRGFISSYGLSEHRASHTGDIRYCCEICGKSFRLYDTYNRHRRHHDDPFPAQCSVCGKKFRNASRVAEHKRKVHTGERPYACPYCPKRFTVTSSYHRHLCYHTNVFPYTCDICHRGFPGRYRYGTHMACKHNDNSILKTSSLKNEIPS